MPMDCEDKKRNLCDWEEEVVSKNSLRWYRLAKDDGTERYIGSLQGYEGVWLMFRLRTTSAGLLQDKRRCRLCSVDRCVMCDSGEVEDVDHFLIGCTKFGKGQKTPGR